MFIPQPHKGKKQRFIRKPLFEEIIQTQNFGQYSILRKLTIQKKVLNITLHEDQNKLLTSPIHKSNSIEKQDQLLHSLLFSQGEAEIEKQNKNQSIYGDIINSTRRNIFLQYSAEDSLDADDYSSKVQQEEDYLLQGYHNTSVCAETNQTNDNSLTKSNNMDFAIISECNHLVHFNTKKKNYSSQISNFQGMPLTKRMLHLFRTKSIAIIQFYEYIKHTISCLLQIQLSILMHSIRQFLLINNIRFQKVQLLQFTEKLAKLCCQKFAMNIGRMIEDVFLVGWNANKCHELMQKEGFQEQEVWNIIDKFQLKDVYVSKIARILHNFI